MMPAGYEDIPAEKMARAALEKGGHIKVIAGEAQVADQQVKGVINPDGNKRTDPQVWDIVLNANETVSFVPKAHWQGGLYLYDGTANLAETELPPRSMAVLTPGESITLVAGSEGARLLFLAGRPLKEDIAQYGPFVMNTEAEIIAAIQDYQTGRLTQ